jgi:hypothetical protein
MMNDKNKAFHIGLMKILDDGTFPLKAREVSSFAAVYNWVKSDLPQLLAEKPKATGKKGGNNSN